MPDDTSTRIEVGIELSEATRRNARDALQRFTEELAATGSVRAAAAAAGVNSFTAGQWLRDKRLQNAVWEERQRLISTEGASIGYAAMREIVTKKRALCDGQEAPDDDPYVYPATIRLKAATDMLRLGGHTEAAAAQRLEGSRGPSLEDMSEDQLAAHIAEAQRLLTKPNAPADAPDSPDTASLL